MNCQDLFSLEIEMKYTYFKISAAVVTGDLRVKYTYERILQSFHLDNSTEACTEESFFFLIYYLFIFFFHVFFYFIFFFFFFFFFIYLFFVVPFCSGCCIPENHLHTVRKLS